MLAPHFSWVDMPKGLVLVGAGELIEAIYFPETAIGSIVATSPEGLEVEAGLFGRDGFGPTAPLMDVDRVSGPILVQVAGHGWRITTQALLTCVDQSATLRRLLARYVQTLITQTGQTALSNAMHQVDERLARWLLMIDDRVDGGEFLITHEFLSIMLGVRRPSVTTSLHVLEGNGFIRSARGTIVIRDRAGLEAFAGDSYGKPEAAYEETVGPLRSPPAPTT